jgi:hypothetical protein
MASVLNKTTSPADFRPRANTPDFPPGDWWINPDVSAVYSSAGGVDLVPRKYWAVGADPVLEMDAAAKAAVDAAEAAALTAANRVEAIEYTTEVDPDGVRTRALIELLNKRDNYLVNRIAELQAALVALQASGGNAGARLGELPTSYLATATRTKDDAVQDYTDDINAGNQDT